MSDLVELYKEVRDGEMVPAPGYPMVTFDELQEGVIVTIDLAGAVRVHGRDRARIGFSYRAKEQP